ncbi:DcaP family trimeric outer membrane transporter [Bradyrhizobium sp. Ash2021]|uniref:DcaP family trimeric outer membrane transporter n=1 Tax=Bradyrhizobium sp. Ash2021 TaxID=2954771 RepID=UPI0028169EF0|nr:DcaP family trimeric outer membrane transporter [Bradyrhizobium sp. Ash2021]WMT77036.1 porin [Bradyrhizobium sp. Ash2021]
MRRADVLPIPRELILAALQLPLAAFIAGTANAQSPQQLERMEALIRAQAVQIEQLNLEMKALKKAQSKTPRQAETASRQAGRPPPRVDTVVEAAPPAVRTPGAIGSPQYPNYVIAGDKKLSWKLPGSDVSLRIGGYAKLDAIGITGGDRSVGANDQFNVFQIQSRGTSPTGTAPGDPRTNIHARQSRIFVEASKTDTPLGPARAYVEADFFGPIDLGTPTVSNSHTFRLRHAYGEVGPLLAGQTWSTFVDPTTYPEVLDFTGPGGEAFIRQGQVRYTHNFGGGLTASVAVENPQSRIRIGEGPVSGTGAAPAATGLQVIGVGPFARDSTPDFIARIRYESPQFNLQLSGVGTRSAAPPATPAASVVGGDGKFGFGVLASAQIALPLFNDKDNFRFQAGYLDGASRYLLDVASTAPSVAYNATLTQFDSIKAFGGFGALQHWWTDKLRTNLVYSLVKIDNPIFAGPAAARETQYGVVNLIYSPWPDVDIGAEFQYGQRTDADGRKGNQTRIQSSLIYRF